MSRTIRFRKGNYVPWWNNYEWYYWYETPSEVSPEEMKKRWWKSHKDDKFNFKEPGPHWWRNYFDRSYRRKGKREIQKFMLDFDYEPIITKKPILDYWT
jgi:hypothetical protein